MNDSSCRGDVAAVETHKRSNKSRERRVARRRAEILAAAARAFSENGYAATTIAQIAEAADLAEGTLYNYFPSKRDLLLAVAAETARPVEEVIDAASELHNRTALVDLIGRALALPEGQRAPLRAVLAEIWLDDELMREFLTRRLEPIHRHLAAYISCQIASGQFRPVDPELTATLVMGMFAGVTLPIIRGASEPLGREKMHTMAEAIASLIFDGLCRRAE